MSKSSGRLNGGTGNRRNFWGRLYAGTRHHRKIELLRQEFPADWRSWYVLLEMAIECDDDGWIYIAPDEPYDFKQLAKEIGISRKDVCERFMNYLQSPLKLITISAKGVLVNSFSERNYDSDLSTIRVQKYREKRKRETAEKEDMKRFNNVSEAPPEQRQNKAEIETEDTTPIVPLQGKIFSVQKLAKLWNEKTPQELAKVALPFTRKERDMNKIKKAVEQHPDSEWWEKVIGKLHKLPFCLGKNERGWKITLDKMVRDAEEILDGKYETIPKAVTW